MNKFDEIADAVDNLNFDIKAETLIANLMESGLSPDDFFINLNGTNKRFFSRDVDKADITRLGNNQSILAIYLNRDGLYDSLPEGLFHSVPDKPQRNSNEMSRESKKLRIEEKEARTFFVPFENEIFFQRAVLELAERKILKQFSETLFDQIFPEFWNLDKSLNHKFVTRLVLSLHYSHLIAGNIGLTAKCLEFIIEENVNIKIVQPGQEMKKTRKFNVEDTLSLGSAQLGVSFVCGEKFDDLIPSMEITIGPLRNAAVIDFLEGGTAAKFLECFYNYFIPAGVDAKTIVLTESEKQHFILNDKVFEPILGFNTAI